MRIDEEVKRLGFFTNRFIEATCSSDAELVAIAQVRDDPKLCVGTLNATDDPPMIYVDEIVEVNGDAVPEMRHGYTFFPAENDA